MTTFKSNRMSIVLAAGLIASAGMPACGQLVVYSNGSTRGDITGYNISRYDWVDPEDPTYEVHQDFRVSNSFTVASALDLSSARVGLWTWSTYKPVSLEWSIGTTRFADDVIAGTAASLQSTFIKSNGDYDIYDSVFTLNGTVSSGTTYWFTLHNAKTDADPSDPDNLVMFWDASDGSSTAYFEDIGPSYPFGPNSIPSEAFTLYSVPETETYALWSGLGMLGFAVWRRFSR